MAKKLREHQYKLVIGAPIIFLILLNTTSLGGNTLTLAAGTSAFITIGDQIPVHVDITTRVSTNATGGTLTFPSDILSADSVTRTSSIIDLWSEEPAISNASGTIHWSGGIISPEPTGEHGNVLVANFHPLMTGKAKLTIEHGEILANNGEGTNVYSGSNSLTIYVRDMNTPSPDVNGDGTLSLADINLLYLRTFRPYDPRYDFNGDKKVDWGDVMTVIALL